MFQLITASSVFFFSTDPLMPPSLGGDRFGYMMSMFGQFGVTMIALQWLWRHLHFLNEDRHPIKAPITVYRITMALVMFSVVLRMAPDAIATMSWPDVSAETRMTMAYVNRVFDGISFIPFSISWCLSIFSRPVLEYQLKRQPVPVDLYPHWKKVREPLTIAVMVLLICAALSFR